MTQSNLLQLAKQGDPEAMAALMNLTLQPRGVVARVVRLESYLHISFSSKRPLNRKTLVEFTRKGLSSLETEFFETVKTVKIYGLKVDEDRPLWMEQWEVETGQEAGQWTRSSEKFSSETEVAQRFPAEFIHSVTHALNTLRLPLATFRPAPLIAKLSGLKIGLQQVQPQLQRWKTQFPWMRYLSNYQLTALLVASTAFLSGGVFGVMANSWTESAANQSLGNRLLATPGTANHLTIGAAPEAIVTRQQFNAKTYMQKMNQAQQAFYRKHNRFATSLEELERSASIISQSSAYLYKLTIPSPTQALLTATPKTEGLKGYVATVALPKTGLETLATLCETTAPTVPPTTLSLKVGFGIQCPAGYSKVL